MDTSKSIKTFKNIVIGDIHLGYYSVVSASKIFLISLGIIALLHFLAPSESYAGHFLAFIMQTPFFATCFVYAIFGIALIYYYQKGKTYRLKLVGNTLTFISGRLIERSIVLDTADLNHLSIERSAFERYYSLGTVKIFTTGNHKPTLTVPNLCNDTAQQLYLMLKSSK